MATDLSVIIPAYNEETTIGPVLRQLCHADVREVIVVDGQSDDRTAQFAAAQGAVVVRSTPGRGTQLDQGASAATGDILLFLHADTLLPADFEMHIRCCLARPDVVAGAFRLRIDAPHRLLRIIENVVNWRSRWLGMPYGDQAIFLTAEIYRRVGGFPSYPVMEDFALVRRLRREGRVVIAPAEVVTSARRWTRCGIWRTTLLNQLCIVAYLWGVGPGTIAAWRRTTDRHHGSVRDVSCAQLP